ncbi:hypothetical protein SUGI_0132290 [Cryptomeria japonica]|nr:hypothetical protein SUGI_0132290 [Cryptomeria japonica]
MRNRRRKGEIEGKRKGCRRVGVQEWELANQWYTKQWANHPPRVCNGHDGNIFAGDGVPRFFLMIAVMAAAPLFATRSGRITSDLQVNCCYFRRLTDPAWLASFLSKPHK